MGVQTMLVLALAASHALMPTVVSDAQVSTVLKNARGTEAIEPCRSELLRPEGAPITSLGFLLFQCGGINIMLSRATSYQASYNAALNRYLVTIYVRKTARLMVLTPPGADRRVSRVDVTRDVLRALHIPGRELPIPQSPISLDSFARTGAISLPVERSATGVAESARIHIGLTGDAIAIRKGE